MATPSYHRLSGPPSLHWYLRREPDYFGEDATLVLLFIAKRLKESLALEALLNENGVDYLIEVDTYMGGIIFRGERAGAFFYVLESDRDSTAALLRQHRYRPQQDQ